MVLKLSLFAGYEIHLYHVTEEEEMASAKLVKVEKMECLVFLKVEEGVFVVGILKGVQWEKETGLEASAH